VTGYRSFNASFTNGDVVFYTIDDTLGNWEVGSGTVGTGTLTRATVIVSSNANALVNFGAGAKRVFCSAPTRALLPNQTGNSGKYLTTDGTSPSWSTVTAGTVTSVSGTGTVSGITLSGTVTSSGSLTLGGTLNLSAYNAAGAFTTLSASSTTTVGTNLVFSGTGNRITGDFSNATIANRVMFQTSTVNSGSDVLVIPNGTSTDASFQAVNNSTPTNASRISLYAAAAEVSIRSAIAGTGTYLPMTFFTGGSERVRISTTGVVTVGNPSTPAVSLDPTTANALVVNTGNLVFTGTGNRITGDFSNATVANRTMFQTSTVNGATDILAIPNGIGTRAGFLAYNNSDVVAATANTQLLQLLTETRLTAGGSSPLPMTFVTGGSERVRISTTGVVTVGNPSTPAVSLDPTTANALTLSSTGVLTVAGGTATPAGGSTAARLIFGTTAGFGIYYGSGAPTVSAAQGSIYLRSDGSSTSTRLYVNTNGSTTWTNVTTAA
jgi:hypothetical protein